MRAGGVAVAFGAVLCHEILPELPARGGDDEHSGDPSCDKQHTTHQRNLPRQT